MVQMWRPGWGLGPRWERPRAHGDDWFEDGVGRQYLRKESYDMQWTPPLETFSQETQLLIRVELPGISGEDIDISVLDDVLTISGEKKVCSRGRPEECTASEMNYGNFTRSVRLPPGSDTDRISATFENGVLEIEVPKVAPETSKKIKVSTKRSDGEE
jgi:HSP20 family protein